jgi:hypothetical protein
MVRFVIREARKNDQHAKDPLRREVDAADFGGGLRRRRVTYGRTPVDGGEVFR